MSVVPKTVTPTTLRASPVSAASAISAIRTIVQAIASTAPIRWLNALSCSPWKRVPATSLDRGIALAAMREDVRARRVAQRHRGRELVPGGI